MPAYCDLTCQLAFIMDTKTCVASRRACLYNIRGGELAGVQDPEFYFGQNTEGEGAPTVITPVVGAR